MGKVRIGVIEHIDSAHSLPGHPFCGTIHGHTYKIEVVVSGEIGEDGMVVDFKDLKLLLKEVLARYDHQLLNNILSIPTVENFAQHLFLQLLGRLPDKVKLESIRIWEGEGKYAELSI